MTTEGDFPVLDFLKKFIINKNVVNSTNFKYPTGISRTLNFNVLSVDVQKATVAVIADPEIHGNQQGTIHGGLICELADAAIGTAHSTVIKAGQSFTTIEFKINFIRPSWKTQLRANAEPIYSGKTITHYKCEVINEEDKLVALATSSVMTLNGDKATGR